MTFAKAIKILDLLDHDKEIAVKIEDDSDESRSQFEFSRKET